MKRYRIVLEVECADRVPYNNVKLMAEGIASHAETFTAGFEPVYLAVEDVTAPAIVVLKNQKAD